MNIDKLKQELQNFFIANRVKQILGVLKDEMSNTSEYYNNFLMICSRFNDLQDQKMSAVIDSNSAIIETNTIKQALLALIDKLQQIDLKYETIASHREVCNPILIVTSEKNDAETIKDFLVQLNFVNINVQYFGSIKTIDKYDLIILDNRDFPICAKKEDLEKLSQKEELIIRLQQMTDFIVKTNKFFIYWGEYLFWVNENRDRVHSANSKFALYARVREMLDFINTYRI